MTASSASCKAPIGVQSHKRIRLLLGHNWKGDRRSWWEDHADELETMSNNQFAAKHGVSSSAVDLMYEELFGAKKGRTTAWWKDPIAAKLLRSKLPVSVVAERVGQNCDSTDKARRLLREWDKEQSS